MNMIVTSEWLERHKGEDVVIVDARHDLTDAAYGRREYEKEHLPDAIFVDMTSELADPSLNEGGRYPMPSPAKMATMFANKGINEKTKVVVYDNQNGGMAAGRVWWMLHYLGNDHVAVLEGGFSSWKEKGFKTTSEIPSPSPAQFKPNVRHSQRVGAREVREKLDDENAILIDARASERFAGKTETLDAKAGHIPKALNYFWKGILTEENLWKSTEELVSHFEALPKEKEIIVYCGSGISACPNILALKEAGYNNVKLYPGSWSDWITHEEYPTE